MDEFYSQHNLSLYLILPKTSQLVWLIKIYITDLTNLFVWFETLELFIFEPGLMHPKSQK